MSDSVPERIFEQVNFEKKSAEDIQSMKNLPACEELKPIKLQTSVDIVLGYSSCKF